MKKVIKASSNYNFGYIYSDYLGAMIHKGFTDEKGHHWTWYEPDLVYYRDDVDDRYVEFSDASYIAVKWD